MKQTLIALALALGATAAFAEPTLSNAQNERAFNKATEATAYQAAGLVDDNAPGYPFNP